jgi:HD-GYP domain-containing protein (c-di-GMP phosphodiesterase class II)
VGRAGALAALAPVVRHHHEWWSGGGYPEGRTREAIPLGARIVAVADASMTTDRPYRARRSHAAAIAEIRQRSGEQFDPAVVDALARMPGPEAGAVSEDRAGELATLVEQARAEEAAGPSQRQILATLAGVAARCGERARA